MIGVLRERQAALIARWQQATSWFSPELLAIPLDTVRRWMSERADLGLYRFAIEEVDYQQMESEATTRLGLD